MTTLELAKRVTIYAVAITATGAGLLGIASLGAPLVVKPIISESVQQGIEVEHQRASAREQALSEQIAYLREDIRDLTAEIHASRGRRR